MSDERCPASAPLSRQSAWQARPLILIVESHEDSRNLLETLLELSGYEVVVAQNGEEAWLLAERQEPALILMDTHLPGFDALSLMNRLRGHWRLGSVPIIATSCNSAPAFRRAALTAGCNELLVKPIDLDYLERMLKRHLTS